LGTPILFFGSERVCTATASEQPTGHSGLTSKAEEERFKVFYDLCSESTTFCFLLCSESANLNSLAPAEQIDDDI